ncbi:hypothetical protein AVEN_219931-1 [Araneus ventricosus]|uniref:Uncharacterized protein n=1 Tax=Araneus ventricosus TaxID=182803 RepID=A0A4Y2VTK7_ARAVE|nr:hypothetical protein AVEN_219931-1 [Araneus ventricosus]
MKSQMVDTKMMETGKLGIKGLQVRRKRRAWSEEVVKVVDVGNDSVIADTRLEALLLYHSCSICAQDLVICHDVIRRQLQLACDVITITGFHHIDSRSRWTDALRRCQLPFKTIIIHIVSAADLLFRLCFW